MRNLSRCPNELLKSLVRPTEGYTENWTPHGRSVSSGEHPASFWLVSNPQAKNRLQRCQPHTGR
jgi:hypothetical protein